MALFYDGTLNNRNNIAEREKSELGAASDSYREFGGKGDNSYDNGRTNIAIMEPHVPSGENRNGYDYSFKVYVEGQGTFNRMEDNTKGKALGAGTSGVESRARLGITYAWKWLSKFLEDHPSGEYFIEKIDVDVFGFSRGAAAARRSIFLMKNDFGHGSLYKRIRWKGYYETTANTIEIKFAGLYDTVVSVSGSQYSPLSYLSGNILNQRAVALATQSVQLAAADEHRRSFPLHTIKSAKDRGRGKEYYLPGAHSDVGGSYNYANDLPGVRILKIVLVAGYFPDMHTKRDKLIKQGSFTPDELVVEVTKRGATAQGAPGVGMPLEGRLIELRTLTSTEYMRTSNEENKILNNGASAKMDKDKEWLIAQGWYKAKELTTKVTGLETYGFSIGLEENLVANRKNIKSAYSNIPLKLMAKFARENAIEINPQLERKANHILNKEPDLVILEADIKKYIAKVGNHSKPEDWLDNGSVHCKNIKNIRHDHLHMSAQLEIGKYPRFEDNKRVRYYYDG